MSVALYRKALTVQKNLMFKTFKGKPRFAYPLPIVVATMTARAEAFEHGVGIAGIVKSDMGGV